MISLSLVPVDKSFDHLGHSVLPQESSMGLVE